MNYIKKFEAFTAAEPVVKPANPDVKPTTPSKPTPFRRNKPAVVPKPKATAEEVVERFVSLMHEAGEDIKKYL